MGHFNILIVSVPINLKFVTSSVTTITNICSSFVLTVDNWFTPQITGWGYGDFMPLSELRDSSKGFVVRDMLVVQVQMEAISSTKYDV